MKLIFRLIQLFFLIIILSLIFHDTAAKIFLTGFLGWNLGVPVQIEKTKVNLLDTDIEVRGLRLGNPSNFPEGTLVYIPVIFVDFEAWDLLKGRIHFETVEIDCEDIRIVRNEAGQVNWLSLRAFKARKSKPVSKNAPAYGGPPPAFQIDQLVLSLGTASYVDLYSQEPLQKSLSLNMKHAIFSNVRSFQDVVGIVVWETMKRVGLSQMAEAFENFPEKSISREILEKAFKGFKLKF
ncbi:MAG: hypothetical protein HYZ84_02670 [Candidatus Omnitrophica bacterium]|nr:hypothetical protein [Candidatus Omnitrophota bacterium]